MTFAVGIFDLIAYAIPGSLYLSAFAYVCNRAGWIDVAGLFRSPSLVLLVALVIACYVVGQATYGLGKLLDHLDPFRPERLLDVARATFVKRDGIVPTRLFLQVDPFNLQAAAEMHNKEAAIEISRLRAGGLMLRGAVLPLLIGAGIAFIEIFTSTAHLFAGVVGGFLLLTAAGCLWHASKLRNWAIIKTLELCYWIKDIDANIRDWTAVPIEQGKAKQQQVEADS